MDGAKRVTIFGEKIEVRASIKKLENISGHADQEGLIKWLSSLNRPPCHIFVVHGEERVAHYFAGLLGSSFNYKAWAPEAGQSFDLLKDHLPVATEAKRWVGALEELKGLYQKLDHSFAQLEGLYKRLRSRGENLDKEVNTEAQRVADAVERLVDELDEVNERWGS